MNILLIGQGVIGTIYATNLLANEDKLFVLRHGQTGTLSNPHLAIQEKDHLVKRIPVTMVDTVTDVTPDLVLIAVRSDQLTSTFTDLEKLADMPLLFIGNNPDGHTALPERLRARAWLGFPGVAGYRDDDGVVHYEHVSGQATILQASHEPVLQRVQKALQSHGFTIKMTDYMDGWLQYHAVFIACMCQAILDHDGDATKLGNDKVGMKLLCRAISQGFAGLRRSGVKGAPANLRILHFRLLLSIAVSYWAKAMKSGQGEMYFAKHARGSVDEVHMLVVWVLKAMDEHGQKSDILRQLLKL